jgi:ketosteroid isomerase-like protein
MTAACQDRAMHDPRTVVRRYYALVADLASTPDDLAALLHPDVRVTEHPNAITPRGAVRDRDATLAGFAAGKALLSAQSFDVHEVVAAAGDPDRVAVRATWRGTIARGAGRLTQGAELVAHIAALLTVADGQILEHETFDCYEPLPAATG